MEHNEFGPGTKLLVGAFAGLAFGVVVYTCSQILLLIVAVGMHLATGLLMTPAQVSRLQDILIFISSVSVFSITTAVVRGDLNVKDILQMVGIVNQ